MVSKYAGRSTRAWKRLAAGFRAKCEGYGLPCWLCGQRINYRLPPEHPESFSVDHYHPVSTHPELAEDPANLRPSHLDCNKRRGTKAPQLGLGRQTRQW